MLHLVQIKSCGVLKFGSSTKKTIIFTVLSEKQYQTVHFWLNFSNHGKFLINPKNVVVHYNTKTIPGGFLTRLWNSTPCLLSQCPEVDCGCYQFSAAIERISWHSSAKMATCLRGGLCWRSCQVWGSNGERKPVLRVGRLPSDVRARKLIAVF